MQVRVVNTIVGVVAPQARALLHRALAPVERDHRFGIDLAGAPTESSPAPLPPPFFVAALATLPDRPVDDDPDALVGYLGGAADRQRLRLDGLVDDGRVDGADTLTALLAALEPRIIQAGAGEAELWGRPARPWHAAVATAHGFEPARALHQMRCRLPVATPPLPTRAFEPGRDLDQLLLVNNRAFVHHPDQGDRASADLAATMAEPWFRADGLRILERDGRIIGFCWTKIHQPVTSGEPALGEIYVIGVDPDFHGQGLGAPLTAAGLTWLHDQGVEAGMLYVEADNAPAVRTYERLGFRTVRTDRAWVRPITGP